MWRDHRVIVGAIGAALAGLACFAPALAPAPGATGPGTVPSRLDRGALARLVGFAGLAVYRHGRRGRRREP